MSDIASLGIKIDSSQVVTGTGALDKFSVAGKNAAASATNLEKAAAKGGGAIATAGGLARHEMINLSRQIQDVGVSLASGQSPFMVLAQQGTQIADIFGSSKSGSVGGAFKQIISYVGPMRLLALGMGGVAAGGLLAVNSLANTSKALDDVSRSVGTTIGMLNGLQSAAGFKGINSDDFLKGMGQFGDDVYRAKAGMGGLAEVFRANNLQAKSFNDYLFKAADLIKNAKDDQERLQLLQQMGLPANMQWVRYLSQGADGIKLAIKAAGEFNETAEGKLIAKAREFDEAWDTATTRWGNRLKGWILSATVGLDGLIERMKRSSPGFVAGLTGTTSPDGQPLITGSAGLKRTDYDWGGDSNKSTVDPADKRKRIADRQTYLGLLGQTMTAEQAAEQVRLQADAAYLSTGVAVGETKIRQLQRLAREQTLGITAIKASTDAQKVDAETVGMSVGQATSYAAAQNAINEARRAGRELTPGNIASIQAESAALGAAAQNADNMRFAYSNLVQGPMQAFTSAIQQGASAMDALKKAGTSALNSIISRLTDMAAQQLWRSAFGGTTGGIFGSLFGGSGAAGALDASGIRVGVNHTGYGPGDSMPSRYVHPAYFDNAPRFHTGIGPGERPAIIRNDESVLTPGQMKAMGKSGPVNIVGPTINVQGNMTDAAMNAIRRTFADHERKIQEIVKSGQSSQRFTATGVH